MKQFTISQKIYMGVKRVIDILLSALALILLSWLFLIYALRLRLTVKDQFYLNKRGLESIRHIL